MKFIITVDTEADDQWNYDEEMSFKNIKGLPKFQTLCEEYGFTPTYLVTYRVANNEEAKSYISAWQKAGRAEIGAHLHPWANPPIRHPKKAILEHAYPSELEDILLKEKLVELTGAVEINFGARPTSYRAGRWGMDERQAAILAELGYRVDCSVTPKISWRKNIGKHGGAGGPDFRFHPVHPYYLNEKVLEVPMTILYTGLVKKENSALGKIYLRMPNLKTKQIINRLVFRKKWLRIFANSDLSTWKRILHSARKNELPAIQFMIHSPELMQGSSPYSRDFDDVEHIVRQLTEMFRYFREQGLEGTTLSQFAQDYTPPQKINK